MRLRDEIRGFRQMGENILEHLVFIRGQFMSTLAQFNQAFSAYQAAMQDKLNQLQSKVDALSNVAPAGNPDLDAAIQEVVSATDALSSHVDTAPPAPSGDSSGATGAQGTGTGGATDQPGTAAPQADAGQGQNRVADTAGNRS